MPDSPRDPAAEAEKMLREMEARLPDPCWHHTAANVLHSDLIALLRELVERREGDRWIPVSERMPPDESCMVAWDWERTPGEITSVVCEATYGEEGFMVDGANVGFCQIAVTHWRPLPAPPAEEKTRGEKT